jgi:hypothetical protein
LKNTNLTKDQKKTLVKNSVRKNEMYLLMRKFFPIAFVVACMSSFCVGSAGNWRGTLMCSGVSVPLSWLVGQIFVDKVLFPRPQDKQFQLFKPLFK